MNRFMAGGTLVAILLWLSGTVLGAQPRNVILLIGDGMGFEQVKAGGLYLHGAEGTLCFESFPYAGASRTRSANSSVTDSAAAATAMATGERVNNGVISVATPGTGAELETVLEYYKLRGRSVGLVTTTYMTHATPAGFGAHDPSRNNTTQIADDYMLQTRPEVLLGGGGHGMSTRDSRRAGYEIVVDRDGLMALDTESVTMVSGQFGTDHLPYELDGYGTTYPHLWEMTNQALAILENDPDGFFLMVEGGRIDHACHDNHLQRAVHETVAFDAAVQAALDWMGSRQDTLIMVTADHETGGMTVLHGNGQWAYPTVSWSTGGHTGVDVPLYALGPNADLVVGAMDNTVIFEVLACQSPSYATVDLLPGGLPRVLWGRIGPGWEYTLESSESMSGEWLPVEPADQWPTTGSGWVAGSEPAGDAVYYRVRIDSED